MNWGWAMSAHKASSTGMSTTTQPKRTKAQHACPEHQKKKERCPEECLDGICKRRGGLIICAIPCEQYEVYVKLIILQLSACFESRIIENGVIT